MYREHACYDCKFLSHCDQHWDEKYRKWDYPRPKIIWSSRSKKLEPVKDGVYDKNISDIPFRDE
jgi:hypothetical protein